MGRFFGRVAAACNSSTFRVVDVQDRVQIGSQMDSGTCHSVAMAYSPVAAFLDDGGRVAVEHCVTARNAVDLASALALLSVDKRETNRTSRAVACRKRLVVDSVADRSSWSRAEVEHRGQKVPQRQTAACSCPVLVGPYFA